MTPFHLIDPPHELGRLIRSTIERHLAGVASRIHADVYDHDVVLSGVVGSWYHKQMVQEAILALDEIAVVDNRLIVDYEEEPFDPTIL